jgi:hypothetical protein
MRVANHKEHDQVQHGRGGSADGQLLAALAGGPAAAKRQLLAWDWRAGRVAASAPCHPDAEALSACPDGGGGGGRPATWAVRGPAELRLWHLEPPQGFRARSALAWARARAR